MAKEINIKGAELLVRTLEKLGVSRIFGLPGDSTQFFRALRRSHIKFVTMRDERGAGFAADVYGRLTKKPAVVYVSRGPGGINAAGGITSSYLDASPAIYLIDQVLKKNYIRRTHMSVEFDKVLAPISKGVEIIWKPDDIPGALARAWADALSHPRGPRCIIIPQDVFDESADFFFVPPMKIKTEDFSTEAADRLAFHLNRSKTPIAILGKGVLDHTGSPNFKKFIENHPIPFLTTRFAKGAISETHDRNYGIMAGRSELFKKADLVITIGFDHTDKPGSFVWLKNDKKINHLDIAHFERPQLPWFSPDENYSVDLANFFEIAQKKISPGKFPALEFTAKDWRKKITEKVIKEQGGKLLYKILSKEYLGGILGKEDVIISDTGVHKRHVLFAYEAPGPNSIFSVAYSTIGFAVPGAIGASFARPKARVIAVCGDGGFLMSMADLETIRRFKFPIKIIIVADNSYGLIKQQQQNDFGGNFGADFTNPKFSYIAKAFGFQYVPVRLGKDLKNAKRVILSKTTPAIIVLYEKYRYK